MVGLGLVCALAACDVDSEDGDTFDRSGTDNGTKLNGTKLNGVELNGLALNGTKLNGWSLNGWSLNGTALTGVTLNGSAFSGQAQIDGQTVALTGTQLIGAVLELDHEGTSYQIRFDDIYKDPARPSGDVYFYQVSVYQPATSTWTSLCTDLDGAPTQAIPIANYWNMTTGARVDASDVVTLACRKAVLAKCVEWGYRPWATATQCKNGTCSQVSLADFHQACTRMARADYCGDGTPHTVNGTPIDVYDRLSPVIQAEATSTIKEWRVEAEWGPNGATCVGDNLRLDLLDLLGINYSWPGCVDALATIRSCGNFDKSRPTRIANRYCNKWGDKPENCNVGNDDNK